MLLKAGQTQTFVTQGTGRPVNMEEEFRLLTLQVIGEAILGLHHDECDQVGTVCLHCHHVWPTHIWHCGYV